MGETRKVRSAVAVAGALLVGGALLGASTAAAKDTYLAAAEAKYPVIVGSQIDSCSLCHTSVPSLNRYGRAFKRSGHNFDRIRRKDSDRDGFRNIREIRAKTFPGNASSHP